MGEHLIGRPTGPSYVPATLRGQSSPFAGDLEQYRGFTTPLPSPPNALPTATMPNIPERVGLSREDWESGLPPLFRSPMFRNIREGMWNQFNRQQMQTLPAMARVPTAPTTLGIVMPGTQWPRSRKLGLPLPGPMKTFGERI